MNTTDTTTTIPSDATHSAVLNGETVYCNPATYSDVVAALVARHGGGVPRVEALAMSPAAVSVAVAEVVAAADTTPHIVVDSVLPATPAGSVDAVGMMRSSLDAALATANGFAVAQPLFARGTRVNDTGVDNARQSRLEHDAKPLVADYCADFIGQIQREERHDLDVRTGDIRMNKAGQLVVADAKVALTRTALDGLVARLGVGGASYLARCKPELRAINVNHHARDLMLGENEARAIAAATPRAALPVNSQTKIRVRRGTRAGLEAFGIVSPSYTPFDVDRIADALRLAAPDDARGTVTYDGVRARFEVVFHTDVRPEEFVAGEFFKAAVIIETADDGTGGLNVSAAVFQNLCLNLIVIDQAKQYTAKLRHVGTVAELARRFRTGFAAAIQKINPFIQQWGAACREDALARAIAAADATATVSELETRDMIRAVFNGVIERELVPVRLNGRKRTDVIDALMVAYDSDTSSARRNPDGTDRGIVTRAAVVNAFTRFAHESPQSSPWDEDEIQRAAGALLWPAARSVTPAPLPYLPM